MRKILGALAVVGGGLALAVAPGAAAQADGVTALALPSPICTGVVGVNAGGHLVAVPAYNGNQRCYMQNGDGKVNTESLKTLQTAINICYIQKGRLSRYGITENLSLASPDTYGPKTKAAVVAVQKWHGIAADGGWGPQTRVDVMLFGHVSAEVRGRSVDLGPPAQRALFGLLALYAPAAPPYETIVATLWPDDPPRSARATVQKYVQRLRAALGPECPPRQRGQLLRTCGDTYALTIGRERVDVLRFRARFAHVAALRAVRDPAYEAALADVIDHADDPVALDVPLLGASPRVLAVKAEQAKLVDWYADLRIAAGRADEVVGLVREQAALRPLDEDSQARLIAVYRQIGCRSAAVDVYLLARRHLSDLLGLDPGPELEDAYLSVLAPVGAGPPAAGVSARA